MAQPQWKLVGHIGDRDPIAYGGAFVYVDETGVYCPEMSWIEPGSDEEWKKEEGKTKLRVYRVLLENDATREWFYERLADVASFAGQPLEEMQKEASGTPMERAMVYDSLIRYYGTENFDSSPDEMTEDEAYAKYAEEMKLALAR